MRGSIELARFAIGARGEGRSEANVLLRGDLGVGLPSHFGTDDTAAPVLHSGSGQSDPNQNNGDGGHDGRKDLLEAVDGQNRKGEFEKATDHGRSEHGPVGDASVHAVAFHLVNGNLVNGQKGKGSSHDTQDPGADVDDASKHLFGKGHGNLENVDDGANAGGDQAGADGVLEKNQSRNRIEIESNRIENEKKIATVRQHSRTFAFVFAL